jgi:hypothetical protein
MKYHSKRTYVSNKSLAVLKALQTLEAMEGQAALQIIDSQKCYG